MSRVHANVRQSWIGDSLFVVGRVVNLRSQAGAAAFLGITHRTVLQAARVGRIPEHALDSAAKKNRGRLSKSY